MICVACNRGFRIQSNPKGNRLPFATLKKKKKKKKIPFATATEVIQQTATG
jgi:hypothetical protein